jgi:hypothetical protein
MQIEMDDSIKIPEGYTARIGYPKLGDKFVDCGKEILTISTWTSEIESTVPRIILNVKQWRAERGGRYYAISGSCSIENRIERNLTEDQNLYDVGNYFETIENANNIKCKVLELFAGNLENRVI